MSRESNQNEPSSLLSDDENRTVFTVLGARRLSKATAVVQMFHAHPSPSQWNKFRTGVVCFVKDNMQRSYFIRLVDIGSKTIVYEQELYDQFRYKRDRPCFHSYPGDKFTVGLNFASEDEADKFGQAVESKINYVRRATMKRKPPGQDTAGQPTAPVINRPPVNVQRANADMFSNKKPLQKKGAAGGKPKKLTKADIGLPTDFRHLAHVGWDPSTGAFDSSNINPEWRKLLDTVGVTEEQLKDKDTANFIYDFVEKRGGIEKATQELENSKRKPPPPPYNRGPKKRGNNRAPPAPPQPRDVPPAPPSRGGGNVPAPPPPPPIGVPAPPPPPPVAAGGGGGPPPPPSRGSSKPLPRVDDARSNLLASIRQGKQLKSVSAVEPEEDDRENDPELDGMAGALQRALALRQNAIHGSDSDNDEGDEDDDDEEDWD